MNYGISRIIRIPKFYLEGENSQLGILNKENVNESSFGRQTVSQVCAL